jgi:hypothetical protein
MTVRRYFFVTETVVVFAIAALVAIVCILVSVAVV